MLNQFSFLPSGGHSYHYPLDHFPLADLQRSGSISRCPRMPGSGTVLIMSTLADFSCLVYKCGKCTTSHYPVTPMEFLPATLNAGKSNVFNQWETRNASGNSVKQILVEQKPRNYYWKYCNWKPIGNRLEYCALEL
jgi:hypothetical protein